ISSFKLGFGYANMVSFSFSIGLLVGFLNVGRHLASVFFFVGWYLAVDQYLGMNRSWWSQNRTLKTCRRTPDSGLDTNQTLRTRRSTDFKSASLDYKEGNSAAGSSGFGLQTHGLNGALGLEYASGSFSVELWKLASWTSSVGFLDVDFSVLFCRMVPCCKSAFWNKLVSSASFVLFSSSDMQYNLGIWDRLYEFRRQLFFGFLGTLDVWDEYHL
ncbi:hypothetical protein RhiirA4_471820, partial [Rhizophagus irregularis]